MSILLFLVLAAALVYAIDLATSAPRARQVPARVRIAEARQLVRRPGD
ncbi:MAG TPA: hypothetical protein VFH38_09245 [Jatrophihabitans sp.]|nr:hypothetical protein [Jatrophihabitans sp.]